MNIPTSVETALSPELIGDAPCGFLSTHPNGNIIYANKTLARWLGYETGKLPAKFTIRDIFTKSSGMYYEAQIAPMLRLQRFVREISCQLATRDAQRSLPVLMNATLREASAEVPERIDFVFFGATERQRFEATLREARAEAEELAVIVRNATVGVVRVDHEGRLKRWNAAAEALVGSIGAKIDGKAIGEVLKLGDTDGDWFQLAKKTLEDKGDYRFESNIRDEVFLGISVAEIVNVDDPFAQSDYSIILRNVTDRVRDNKRLNLMVRELNHRVKNTLAVVSVLVRQSFRGAEFEEERRKLLDRLQNISVSNDILTSHYWDSVEISELVRPLRAQLDNPERIVCEGPKILLNPNQFKAISMAFHELTTNALKYGALSNESGTVSIRWLLEGPENNHFTIAWDETGGPPVQAPEKSGFGTMMIENILSAEFEGKTELDFRPEGLQFRFSGTI